MRSRFKVLETEAAHFITSTVIEWLPVFTTAACCDVLVESLDFCRREKGLRLYGWVIMDHHFHAVVDGPDLSRTIADLKKYTAKLLLEQLPKEGRAWLVTELAFLPAAAQDPQPASGVAGGLPSASCLQRFRDAAESSGARSTGRRPARRVPPEGGINLDYLHANPVRSGKVASPEHWRYSSAHEWLPGATPVIHCDPWK